ncbi:hypothetical protein [Vibrio parahaemolyticus]|uniref:hypothetical protein n=1 Tax=Vibrio parahaemolyticus TaxID=670 RepID=UPI0004282C49|nr:hypothetical protein [Vibrio parahaemolyticus]MBE4801828.1 hypothetical protein [Vibrio parahaemolyticus]MDF4268708.1 hypothetical protein [Vibrio parahaemolyticus]MDF4274044.1 hypothetical protein [Vibrio parahaemolyticus]MDF4298574.1 hypothetical protein [Vibrio parahaemolyticus]HCG7968496.1 hypothetical protein [Vibrio parahaemolyticus]
MANPRIEELNARLLNIVQDTCNKIGCDNCGLKWDGGCSATEVEGELIDLQIKESNGES